jgi:cation diffusion facilitator CzcD-associated flavoprotein CzcO
MFYCHALETKRRQLQEQEKSVEELPIVTVLERASTPGGVWRSEQRYAPTSSDEKKESELTGLSQATQMVSLRFG